MNKPARCTMNRNKDEVTTDAIKPEGERDKAKKDKTIELPANSTSKYIHTPSICVQSSI